MTTTSPPDDLPWIERTGVLRTVEADSSDATRSSTRVGADLETLLALRSPTLAPLVRTSTVPGGVALTHLVPALSESLEALRSQGPLRAGHAVTVGLAVLDAVIDLHAHDLVHGAITSEQVLVAPDGSIVLGGTGLAWSRIGDPDRGPSRADDIAAAGALVRDCLGAGAAPSALVLAALRACDSDPRMRPTAVELRGLIARCGRPESLLDALWRTEAAPAPTLRIDPRVAPSVADLRPARARSVAPPQRSRPEATRPTSGPELGGGSPDPGAGAAKRSARASAPARRTPSRRITGRPLVVVSMLALCAVAGLLAAGLRVMPGALAAGTVPREDLAPMAMPPATTPTAAPVPSQSSDAGPAAAELILDRAAPASRPDWPTLIAALDDGRLAALSLGSVERLREWVDPQGSSWAGDAALADRVRARGARIEGGALVALDVRIQTTLPTLTVLLVLDRRQGYTVVIGAGRTTVAERAPRWWRVTLTRAEHPAQQAVDGPGQLWRIRDVVAVAAPSSVATTGPAGGR